MAGQMNPALVRALMQRMGMGAGPGEEELGLDLTQAAGAGLPVYRGESPQMLQPPPREVMDPEALNMGEGGVPGMDLRGMSPALLEAAQRRKKVASKGGKQPAKKDKG